MMLKSIDKIIKIELRIVLARYFTLQKLVDLLFYVLWVHIGVREMKVQGWQAEIWPYIEKAEENSDMK